MILNSKKEKYIGIISTISVLDEYDDELDEIMEDYDSTKLWLKLSINNKKISVVVPRNSYYGNFFVGDKVELTRTITLYSEEEYREKLKEKIDTYCCYISKKEKLIKFNQILENKKSNYVINYDINKIYE